MKPTKTPAKPVEKTDEMASKLESTLQHLHKMKEMILQGERPKDIAAELNVPVQMVSAVLKASDIEKHEIYSLRQFRPKRAVFMPKMGAHKFNFWVVLPKEIKTYRVAEITDTTIVIEMNLKEAR